jgi:hypothetical protein
MFTVSEARSLLPEVLQHSDELISVRADLVEFHAALAQGLSLPHRGGLAEAKGYQAHLSELLGWFPPRASSS